MTEQNQNSEGQFTLRALFSWTSLVAIFMLNFTVPFPGNIVLFLLFLAIYLVVIGKGVWVEKTLVGTGMAFVAGIVFLGFIAILSSISWRDSSPISASRMNSINARQIGLALLNYEEAHGHFPPPYTVDADGIPLHSWRVLILPYLEYDQLYNSIDLEKPWNHPDNKIHWDYMPEVYKDAEERHLSNKTKLVAIVSDNTMWPTNGQGRKFDDFSEDSGEVISVLFAPKFAVNWMSPNDPTFEEFKSALEADSDAFKMIGTVAWGDGSVSTLEGSTQTEMFSKIQLNMIDALKKNENVPTIQNKARNDNHSNR